MSLDMQQDLMKFFESRVGSSAFQDWFKQCSISCNSGVGIIHFPNSFVKDWVMTHYSDVVENAFEKFYKIHNYKAVISQINSSEGSSNPNDYLSENSIPLNPYMTFDTFVTGKSNELAFETCKRVSNNSGIFNPLVIYGKSGFGKTHLLESISWNACKSKKRVCFTSAEQYMMSFIKSIQSHDTMSFKNSFRNVDILLIDDIQFIAGKDSTQEELFHTFAFLINQRKQLVFSADKPPQEMSGIENRLKSRLGSGLVVQIYPAPYELRLGILEQKIRQNNKSVDKNILCMIAEKVETSARELEGALMRICAQIEFLGYEMNLETAEAILNEMFSQPVSEMSSQKIIDTVAAFYGVDSKALRSQSRIKNIVKARQVAMFLCRDVAKKSLPEIGKLFGGKDHTTALYSVKQVEEKLKQDVELRGDMSMIRQSLMK